jgi:hypothetical protein
MALDVAIFSAAADLPARPDALLVDEPSSVEALSPTTGRRKTT